MEAVLTRGTFQHPLPGSAAQTGSHVEPALTVHTRLWALEGLLAHAHVACLPLSWTRPSPRALAGLPSLLSPVLAPLLLYPGQNPLVEQQVGARGQDLLQAGLADAVVGDPQPLVAG